MTSEEKRKIYEEEKARIETQEKAKDEIKAQKDKKNLKWGCIGCLSIIILVFVIGIIIFMINDEKPQTSRQRSTSAVEINKYVAILRGNGIMDTLAVSVSAGRIEGEITISVSNVWHIQAYQVRLQAAQNLWKLWANIHSPLKPDKAYIRIVDFNGNSVGGSRGGAGSLIWVQKE